MSSKQEPRTTGMRTSASAAGLRNAERRNQLPNNEESA
jgi:hypothetical protein